jgi:hypothetical protein
VRTNTLPFSIIIMSCVIATSFAAARSSDFGSSLQGLLTAQDCPRGRTLAKICSRLGPTVLQKIWRRVQVDASIVTKMRPKAVFMFVELLAAVRWRSEADVIAVICLIVLECVRTGYTLDLRLLTTSIFLPLLRSAAYAKCTLLQSAAMAVANELPGIDCTVLAPYL